jgi:hypothetical protein
MLTYTFAYLAFLASMGLADAKRATYDFSLFEEKFKNDLTPASGCVFVIQVADPDSVSSSSPASI